MDEQKQKEQEEKIVREKITSRISALRNHLKTYFNRGLPASELLIYAEKELRTRVEARIEELFRDCPEPADLLTLIAILKDEDKAPAVRQAEEKASQALAKVELPVKKKSFRK